MSTSIPSMHRIRWAAILTAVLALTTAAATAGPADGGTLIAAGGVPLSPTRIKLHLPASPPPCLGVFKYAGAEQVCAVPSGVTQLNVVAVGGKGGMGAGKDWSGQPAYAGAGGLGGYVNATLAVHPGELLYVEVGGNGDSAFEGGFGAGGWNGGGNGAIPFGDQGSGGGGGATDVRTVSCAQVCSQGGGFGVFYSLASRLIVAAGGGGGGSGGSAGGNPEGSTRGGDGGNAGAPGGNATISGTTGIAGGGGGAGAAGGAGGSDLLGNDCDDGAAGRIAIGGGGGDNPGDTSTWWLYTYAGGGGGGGYFGGGGADAGCTSWGDTVGGGGGGGGGSSYGPAGSTIAVDYGGEDPYVRFTPA